MAGAVTKDQTAPAPVLAVQDNAQSPQKAAVKLAETAEKSKQETTPQESVKSKEQLVKPEESTTKAEETTPTKSTKPVEPTETTAATPPSTTTTSAPPTTTTSTPPTSSSAPATTTVAPAPTPVPAPSQGKWVVNSTGKVCLIVQMAAQFHIFYNVTENKTLSTVFNLPIVNGSTNASGICGLNEQNLTITWMMNGTNNNSLDQFVLHFVKNETTSHYSLHHLGLQLSAATFPTANLSAPLQLVHEQPSFSIGLSNSYRCIKQQKLDLKGDQNATGHIILSDLQFQAFRSDNSTVFGLAKDCAYDVPDVVPIAVGCALAGLVVIILIAYLVNRRRNQVRGYLSM